jgi:hypothetical protein
MKTIIERKITKIVTKLKNKTKRATIITTVNTRTKRFKDHQNLEILNMYIIQLYKKVKF